MPVQAEAVLSRLCRRKRRRRPRPQRLINHNCFNSINDVCGDPLMGLSCKTMNLLEFSIVMSGLATGRRHSALFLRAVLACASLLVVDHADAHAQASIGNLLNPVQDGFANPQDLPGQQLSQADQSPRRASRARRRRASARRRLMAPPRPPALRMTATTRSTASARSRSLIPARRSSRAVSAPATAMTFRRRRSGRSRRRRPPTRRRWRPQWPERCLASRRGGD